MFKGRAELIDQNGVVVATFNETCHDYGTTFATVRLRAPLAPFTLQGTELLALFAKGSLHEAAASSAFFAFPRLLSWPTSMVLYDVQHEAGVNSPGRRWH